MPNSPATDIAQMLNDAVVGTLGTDLFIGKDPPAVATLTITVYDTGGLAPNPKWLRDEPTVQCLVRGEVNDYVNAWTKAQLIKDTLLGADPIILGGTDYVLFTQIADILSLGYDESSRIMLVSNWRLVREMQSGGNRFPL